MILVMIAHFDHAIVFALQALPYCERVAKKVNVRAVNNNVLTLYSKNMMHEIAPQWRNTTNLSNANPFFIFCKAHNDIYIHKF